ncbi:Na+/H+ antiporter subunit E [Nocardioides sp. zg-1228]|uniref:Na+/H+ antiporter subunit E n=1 Tax=Nocardioides sp. zg-1228 TaxID=2763008 RepID=UPI0016426A1C|nr:Na+/H+ antiporter subunit E [Nocardioides sp. zg-1228]MBC2934655.1 Na+/H+ antiporter subunit E [Nocardioides sp. zg-1228]QSF55975.1 Na+/H+ antiporter subunit E [Nocardioides sp. zg-1228]
MSPVVRTRPDGSTRPARHRAVQPRAVAWLLVVWLAMWGDVTPLLVVGGVIVAVLVCLAFPLPPIDLGSRVRPIPLLGVIAHFLAEIVRASIEVAGVVLRRRPVRNAVVAVDLETESDFLLTLVASMLSLIPGSVVVEARRSTHTLYLHVLDVPDAEAAETFRRTALDLEQRLLHALPLRTPTPAPTPQEQP